MTDKDGRLSSVEEEKVSKWIDTHPPQGMQCPICRAQAWNVLPQLVSPIPVSAEGRHVTNQKTCTLLLATCEQCGFILTLDASVVGVP